MRLEIRSPQFGVTDSLRTHILKRLHFAVGRFAGRLAVADVRLWDENGPKGGEDKHCSVELRGVGLDVRVDERSGDLFAAVANAAHRASRALRRAVERLSGADRRGRSRRRAGRFPESGWVGA
jgi:ribosome-associated translation inhibitor RaiA